MKNFHVGQKVVCVNGSGRNTKGRSWHRPVSAGTVYVIRWAGIYDDRDYGPQYCVRLVGIERLWWGDDVPFMADRFRPLIERKTDISIFTEMLTKSPELVR